MYQFNPFLFPLLENNLILENGCKRKDSKANSLLITSNTKTLLHFEKLEPLVRAYIIDIANLI